MACVFPPWSNTAFRIGIVALVAVGAAAVLAPWVYVRTPWNQDQFKPIAQPVSFDHRHHVQDDGIDCLYCHKSATRAASAGIPSTETCMGCHNQIWNESPALELVRNSFFSGEPIVWQRVHNLPDFTYFNHAAHTNKGVGCVTCHGRVDQMAQVYKVEPLTMGFCLDCHRNPEPHLRPLDRITDMTYSAGADQARIGHELARALYVNRRLTCTTCHR